MQPRNDARLIESFLKGKKKYILKIMFSLCSQYFAYFQVDSLTHGIYIFFSLIDDLKCFDGCCNIYDFGECQFKELIWDLAIFTSSTTSFQVGSLPSKEQHATHIVVVPAITHVFSYPLHCYQQCITDRKPVVPTMAITISSHAVSDCMVFKLLFFLAFSSRNTIHC